MSIDVTHKQADRYEMPQSMIGQIEIVFKKKLYECASITAYHNYPQYIGTTGGLELSGSRRIAEACTFRELGAQIDAYLEAYYLALADLGQHRNAWFDSLGDGNNRNEITPTDSAESEGVDHDTH